MKVGIVGSSKFPNTAHSVRFIKDIIDKYPPDTIFVSGGAKGVDSVAIDVCRLSGYNTTVFKPKGHSWTAFKERNLIIARYCDEVISIALPLDKTPCYHCNSKRHDKTAGCYTLKYAKKGKVIVYK